MDLRNKAVVFAVTNDLSYDQRMQKVCRSLSTAGYRVELIGRNKSNSIPLANEPYKQTRLQMVFRSGKLFYLEYNIRLFFYLLTRTANVFCAIDLDTIVAVSFAAWLKQVLVAYDAHEYFTEVPEVVDRPVVKKIWKKVEQTFVPRVQLAYTVSPAIAKLFTEQYKVPFHVVMNVPLLTNNISYEKLQVSTILYQGALNKGRGIEQLITAMKSINANLLLAGEGDLSSELRKLVDENNLNHKIHFLGNVNPKDLKAITASATIGVNLLQNTGLSYYYSLSNKFFDYIHALIPQVCIDFPEYNYINNKYEVAVLCESCDPLKISHAIERLLCDYKLYLQLKNNCEVCRLELNWEQEEKKVIELYNELLR